MKRFAVATVVGAFGLLGWSLLSVATASAAGYVTPVFARGMHSAQQPGHVSMDTVKAFLDARGIDGTVSVVTEWPLEHERLIRGGGLVYLSWDDLSSLQGEGWTITSHGRSGLITGGESAAATNSEVNGSLTDLLGRGFTPAWSLYSYKSGTGDALAEGFVRDSYAYGRRNTSQLVTMSLPLAQPERAQAVTTWGGHCHEPSLPCFDAAPEPYRLPAEITSSMNAMAANQWTMLQSYRFVEGTQLTGQVQFDCTGPATQHWTRVGSAGRETYCWNDYQSIIEGTSAAFESPATIAELYGRAIFTGAEARGDVSPKTLAFGKVRRNRLSSPKQLTFMNTGSAPLSITSVTVTGTNPADFRVLDDGCTGTEVPGGGSCTVNVVFAPSASGARSAVLSFAHSAAGSPVGVSLAGTGR